VRDITEQKKQQIRIQRLTNLYATLSQTNQSITHCSNEAELFPQICQFAVQNGGMKMAWIGLVDNDSQFLKSVASYGDGTGYLEHIKISVDLNDPYSHGPSGLCFRENRPLWCQDFQHDPMTKLWHERSLKYGWGSSASLPLQREGVIVGILTLYASTIDAFDEEERRLLTEMASDVSFAMDNFAREVKLRQAEVTLKDSEKRFRILIEQSIAGVYIIQDGQLTYLNPRFSEILGFSEAEELLGKNP
jgi:GAF domain-containing protein